MYLGRIVEEGRTDELFGSVRHPYARALLAAAPRLHQRGLDRPNELGASPGAPTSVGRDEQSWRLWTSIIRMRRAALCRPACGGRNSVEGARWRGGEAAGARA